MELILETLLPDDNPLDDNLYHKSLRERVNEMYETENDCEFTISEISNIINNLKSNKTPGWDQINDLIVKKIFGVNPTFIAKLFNNCLKFKCFPKIWKISIIKVLLKSNDKPQQEITSYRLISLLCVFAKTLEKLLIDRINWYLYHNNLLSEKQFGFKPQNSTQTAINHLIKKVEIQLKRKLFLHFISLDIKGAFDNAFWPSILAQLREKKVPQNLYFMIENYLSDREVILICGNEYIKKKLSKGCPQGSALGPGLWNILYDSLLNIQIPVNSELIAFCDDTGCLITGNDINSIESTANQVLAKLHIWGINNKIQFNPIKTKAILFTNRRKYIKPRINMNGVEIEIVNELKYLGIIIDRKLNFNHHIKYITEKCLKKIHKISMIARNT